MGKSKPQQALLCQSIKRSSGTAGALIMRQTQEGERGCFRGRKHPCLWAHKKTVTHRCKDIQCKRVDILCMYNHTQRTCAAVHFDACLCLYLRRSHMITQYNVSPWMPLRAGLDLPLLLDFDSVCHCICQIEHHTQPHCTFYGRAPEQSLENTESLSMSFHQALPKWDHVQPTLQKQTC